MRGEVDDMGTHLESARGGVVYGPLCSRRLGRSLGVDLTPPSRQTCNFDCVYCPAPRCAGPGGWPSPGDVATALANVLPRVGPLDSITLSGRGEPTLHPRFGAVVASVVSEARRAGVPVRILTNGSRAVDPVVRRALDLLDERIVKLDAAPERVERPAASAPLGAILHAWTLLRDFALQSCFVEGAVSNVDEESVSRWLELVAELHPLSVQIYTIDRPARVHGVQAVAPDRLREIAARVAAQAGVPAQAAPPQSDGSSAASSAE
jgi:wyosine [tRNA(Phe)-imidazoG37] synthetase (radical SAM superfamily)